MYKLIDLVRRSICSSRVARRAHQGLSRKSGAAHASRMYVRIEAVGNMTTHVHRKVFGVAGRIFGG